MAEESPSYPIGVREATRRSGLNRMTIYNAIWAGELPARRFKTKKLLIDSADLDRWLAENVTAVTPKNEDDDDAS